MSKVRNGRDLEIDLTILKNHIWKQYIVGFLHARPTILYKERMNAD